MHLVAFAATLTALASGHPNVQETNDLDVPGVPDVLRAAIKASQKLRFTGTRVVEFRRGPETRRHLEYITRDGVRSRVEFPEDSPFAGQVIVEDGRVRRHYLPAANEIRVLPPRRDESFGRLIRSMRRYGPARKLTVEPGEVVAGRRTQQVAVLDPQGNIMQRLYIDPKSGALLKRKLFDRVGTQVGLFEFTQINFRPRLNAGLFRIERKGATIVTPADALRRTAAAEGYPFLMLRPSSGAVLEGSRSFKMKGQSVLGQFYRTPKGRLTFFQAKALLAPERLRHFSRGDFKVVSWQEDSRSYVLFGPFDEASLDRWAQQLKGQVPGGAR